MEYRQETFEGQKILLDGNDYAECAFVDCDLRYGGSAPVSFDNCRFDNCGWSFVDAASNTLYFMASLYHGLGQGGRDLIEQLFESIRKNPPPGMSPPDDA
ncbi:MAG: hypothetical protein ACLFUE_02070 [Desulfobacteraceae bacterium]